MVGQTIAHYRVLRKLGAGGMGVVFEAEDLTLGRRVALKFLSSEVARDPHAVERFQREARAASALNHSHICTVYELGEHEGQAFLALELLDGQTLRQLIANGPLKTDQILDAAIQVADALDAAHECGIVHRDIKSANILVTRRGDAKVLDFGLAKLKPGLAGERGGTGEETVAAGNHLTDTGIAVGTIAYMSPEQVRGEEVDRRTDLFSLGVVLYEMATGRQAFGGSTAGVVFEAILNRAAVPPSHVNPKVPMELERIVNRLMEKDRSLRYQSAADLKADLKRLKRDSSPESARKSAGEMPRVRKRHRMWAAGMVGAAVVLVFALVALNVARVRDRLGKGSAEPKVVSLAVLPLENRSGGADQEFFADGMTEELITQLQQLSALRVRSRTSVGGYKGSAKRVPQIARELGVDAVVEGSIRRAGDRVRITVRLIRADSDSPLWGESYDRDLRDALTLQSEIARAVAAQVRVTLTPADATRYARAGSVSPEVLDLFLRARELASHHNRDDQALAIGLLERAVQKDPAFARGHGALALACAIHAFNFAPEREVELATEGEASAKRALDLDPYIADAYIARGRLRWTRRNGFPHGEAFREYKRALELSPGSATALGDLAGIYNHVGMLDVGLRATADAIAIDPSATRALQQMGFSLLWQGKAGEALGVFRRIPRGFNPSLAGSHEAWALHALGRKDEAAQTIERLLNEFPADEGGELTAIKAFFASLEGRNHDAETLIASAQKKAAYGHFHHAAYFIAWAYARMKKTDLAIRWLKDTALQGWPCYPLFERDPNLDPLRGDPRFQAVLEEVKAEWERYRTEFEPGAR